MTMIRPHLVAADPVDVAVYASPVVEVLMAMWAHSAEPDDLDGFEHGEEIAEIVEATGLDADDLAWMARTDGVRWSFLVPYARLAEASDLEQLANHLAADHPDDVVKAMLDYQDHECPDGACDHGEFVVDTPAAEVARLVAVLRTMAPNLAERLAAMAPGIELERQLTTFLARRLGTEALIETVTNGIAYRFHANVTEAVLVPSRIMRPWNLVVTFGSAYYFVYPMSDEAADAEADAPPAWLVALHKALGDERRLKLLRRLAQGPAGLQELADVLDVAKSTAHHHVRLLRAASLVRAELTSGDTKDQSVYTLRPNALDDARHFLAEYLGIERSQP